MIAKRERVQKAARNLRSAHNWRPRDMVNWHRLVRPLRALEQGNSDLDVYRLVYNLCTRLHIDYQPHDDLGLEFPLPPDPDSIPDRVDGEPHVAVFVDAPNHISGVATSLKEWSRQAKKRGLHLDIFHSGTTPCVEGAICFPPIGTLDLDAYDGMTLHVPRVVDVMNYIKNAKIDVVHVSTPGPMGLLGRLAAQMLNVPLCGTYHTDFPRYAVTLTGDHAMADITWEFMRWFYGSLDFIAAPSHSTKEDLIKHGIDNMPIHVVGRGVSTEKFNPKHRDEGLRAKWGYEYPHKLLYVGRVSKEKNLDCLVEAYKMLMKVRRDVCLVVVGDGPYLDEMETELQGLPVVFTGFQRGEALARIYASCDMFLFPSETDTLGVVLLEAQASGLPAVVSGQGGPKHCIEPGQTGCVIDEMKPMTLCSVVHHLLQDLDELEEMKKRSREHALQFTPEKSFEAFWNMHRVGSHPVHYDPHPPIPTVGAGIPQFATT